MGLEPVARLGIGRQQQQDRPRPPVGGRIAAQSGMARLFAGKGHHAVAVLHQAGGPANPQRVELHGIGRDLAGAGAHRMGLQEIKKHIRIEQQDLGGDLRPAIFGAAAKRGPFHATDDAERDRRSIPAGDIGDLVAARADAGAGKRGTGAAGASGVHAARAPLGLLRVCVCHHRLGVHADPS